MIITMSRRTVYYPTSARGRGRPIELTEPEVQGSPARDSSARLANDWTP